MRLKRVSAHDVLPSSQIALDPLTVPCLHVSEEHAPQNISSYPYVPSLLVPEAQPCERDGAASLHATGMYFRDDHSLLRNPTDPSGEGETRHIPLSQRKRKAPFLSLQYPSWGAEVTGAVVLSPTWHPDSCWKEAEPLFPTPVSAGTASSARARGPLQPEAVKGFMTRRIYSQHRTRCFQCVASQDPAACGRPLCQESGGDSPACCGNQDPSRAWRGVPQDGMPSSPCQSSGMLW